MSNYIRMLAAVAALLASSASVATAQQPTGPPCFERKALVSVLADQYGEALTAAGLSAGGLLVEVFVSERGTWTITASASTGQICMLANGVEWRPAMQPEDLVDRQ